MLFSHDTSIPDLTWKVPTTVQPWGVGEGEGCGRVFFLSEMGLLPEFWLEGVCLPGVLGADSVAESQFCIAATLRSETTSFTAMSLLLFCLIYHLGLDKDHHQKETVKNLSIEFCDLWYCHERMLHNWLTFVSTKRNAFQPAQEVNLKGKEHRKEISAI